MASCFSQQLYSEFYLNRMALDTMELLKQRPSLNLNIYTDRRLFKSYSPFSNSVAVSAAAQRENLF